MALRYSIAFPLLLILAGDCLGAVTVLECVDKQGNKSFRDKCPPEAKRAGEREFKEVGQEGPDLQGIAKKSPVVLYRTDTCDSCDMVVNLLKGRNIPYTSVDVGQDVAAQKKLQEVTGGALSVPTLLIGDKHITGYSKTEITAVLEDAGYPKEEQKVEGGAPPAATGGGAPPAATATP